MDDDFTYSPERVKNICELLIRKGLHGKVKFQKPNAIRPDRGDQEMFDLMKRAGFYFISIAVEAVDEEVSKRLGRKIEGDATIMENTIRMAKKAGLFVNTFYLMGSPFDTKKTMRMNIDFACKTQTDTVSFFGMKPFPGTTLYDMLKKRGDVPDKLSESIPSCNEIVALYTTNDWSEEDLRNLVTLGYRKFYLSPRRIIKLLPMLLTNVKFFSLLKQVSLLLFKGSPGADSSILQSSVNKELSSISQ